MTFNGVCLVLGSVVQGCDTASSVIWSSILCQKIIGVGDSDESFENSSADLFLKSFKNSEINIQKHRNIKVQNSE